MNIEMLAIIDKQDNIRSLCPSNVNKKELKELVFTLSKIDKKKYFTKEVLIKDK